LKKEKPVKAEEVRAKIKKLVQETLQDALEGELDEFMGYPKHQSNGSDNARNGHSVKTVQTNSGPMEIEVPRDRKSDFQPKLIRKRQTVLDDVEDKIVALYAKGMTTRDIQEILGDMYGMDISPSLISRLTDRVLPRLEEWQSRPLQERYVIVWFDCIFYKVRHEGKVENKAIYVLIGLGLDGKKELLGFWINKTETSSYWLGVFNELKGRGLKDVFIFSVDGLSGIEKAINAAYPESDIQRCIVHQIRNSLKYVSWKERKTLAADMKTVYSALTEEEAKDQMARFEQKWQSTYPHVIKSWRTNWDSLTAFFRYPVEIRKIMYTTNIVESVYSKFRKATSARRLFPTDDAILKSLFMAAMELEKKWTLPMRGWSKIYSQIAILFEDRL